MNPCITESGLGNLLDSTPRYREKERRPNKSLVSITDDSVGTRDGKRIETVHPEHLFWTIRIFRGEGAAGNACRRKLGCWNHR